MQYDASSLDTKVKNPNSQHKPCAGDLLGSLLPLCGPGYAFLLPVHKQQVDEERKSTG